MTLPILAGASQRSKHNLVALHFDVDLSGDPALLQERLEFDALRIPYTDDLRFILTM
jgi:hypothetical protein